MFGYIITINVTNRVLFLTVRELSQVSEGNQKYKINQRSTYTKAKHK